MLKKILISLAATVALLAGSLSVGTPAQANITDCTAYSNVVCMWKEANAIGSVWRQTTAQVPAVTCRRITESGWNNTVTTVRLQSTQGWVLQMYDNTTCTGTPVELFQNFTYDFTGNPWNNKFSSLKLRST